MHLYKVYIDAGELGRESELVDANSELEAITIVRQKYNSLGYPNVHISATLLG